MNMANVVGPFTGEVTVGKAKVEAFITVDLSKLTSDMMEKLALHGLKQKIADAASASKTKDDALGLMAKARDALYNGEWSSRVASEGVDASVRIGRAIVRGLLKAKMGAKSPEWAKFTGMSDADQNAALDKVFAKNEEKLAPQVEAKIAAEAAERKRKAQLTSSLDFDI
jgi:hypothetical protein